MKNEIKKVALLGAGGIGSYFIWGLSELLGDNFCVVASGARAERLRANGLQINGEHFNLHVKAPEEVTDCDLLIVAVKHYSLRDALPTIRSLTGKSTMVISLLNGIDSEEIIGTAIDSSQILYSMIRFSVQHMGNSITFDPEKAEGLVFGEKDSDEVSNRMLALAELLDKTNIHYQMSHNIVAEQWRKFAINISGNLPQAIISVGYGAYFDSEHMAAIRVRLQQETKAVAAAKNIELTLPDPQKSVFAPKTRFSTLQDIDNGRHTEIDMLAGVLIDKAKECGVEVPFTEYTYHLIKALEEKNDGKFDYQ